MTDRSPEREKGRGEHVHKFSRYHADYCHKWADGEVCECGEERNTSQAIRDFSSPDSGWWHWGREGCRHCEELMRQAGLDPAALGDEDLACREIERQFEEAAA